MATNKQESVPPTITGQPETSEPSSLLPTQKEAKRDGSSQSTSANTATTSVPALRKKTSSNLVPSMPPSAGSSPRTSRNTSPIRPSLKQDAPPTATRTGGLRSRQNSHDASPSRSHSVAPPIPSVPSAAAIQRALSATNVPQLQPASVTEAVSKLPRTSRPTTATSENPPSTTPHWPAQPRLKSPPPSNVSSRRSSAAAQRKPEPVQTPPITIQHSTPPIPAEQSKAIDAAAPAAPERDQLPAPSTKPVSRGPSGPKSTLETVEENTPPSTGTFAPLTQTPSHSFSSVSSQQNKTSGDDKPAIKENGNRVAESESEGNKSDGRGKKAELNGPSTPRAKIGPKGLSLTSAKSRQTEGTRNMTVETETVSSIPQSQLNADRSAASRGDGGGSVRLKPSSETIRPRKERKRPSRKTASVHNGTASSKADIFEARVASAVDEANSSDSDETFVYESNPPEPVHRVRNHSRTPSATSIHSQNDRRMRGLADSHRVAGKRSMKFSNNPYNLLDSPTDPDSSGTVRSHQHRHISRYGRHVEDSPFTQASKLRTTLVDPSRQGSRPSSPLTPRSAQSGRFRTSEPWSKKNDLSQYDFEDGADDERTPLVGSVRTSRNTRSGRRSANGRGSVEDIYNIRHTSWFTRFGGCMLGFIIMVLVVIGAAGFLVMSNRTLYNVQVRRILNVLASEQELILDLYVGAVNPNVLAVTVTDMEVSVFAKSRHLGPEYSLHNTRLEDLDLSNQLDVPDEMMTRPERTTRRQVGKIPPSGDSQTMLLGRIFHFDTALYFEGSPLQQRAQFSKAELRLMRPGNMTEAGGSARWERVLQYPFELILRGVIKYRLPISNKEIPAGIAGSILVNPEEGIGGSGWMTVGSLEDEDEGEEGV